MEAIRFKLDDGTLSEEVFIIAQTMINGIEYFLVSEKNDEENCYLLKNNTSNEEEVCLIEVEDSEEWESVSKVFKALLDEDIDLEI